MPGPFALTLETPALAAPAGWEGPITAVLDAVVDRAVNRAGAFNVTIPMSAHAAADVRRGWRCTLRQERIGLVDSAGAAVPDLPLLYRGKVLKHTPLVDAAGQTILVLEGETFLGQLADSWIPTESNYQNATLDEILDALLTPLSLTWSVPVRCETERLSVQFSDLNVLQALIRLADLTKTNLRDGWNGRIEFTDQYQLPDPEINLNADDPVVRLVRMEGVGPAMKDAGRAGFGIIAGTPTASWEGLNIANRIKVIGANYDGTALTLQGASYFDSLYTVQTGTRVAPGPADSANYYYVQDDDSVDLYGLIEVQIVRSDIKALDADPAVAAASRAAMLAIANGELLKRRSPTLTFSAVIANGEEIYALPGDTVHVRYKGIARTLYGVRTEVDIDRFLLVYRRGERAASQGVKIVTLDLVTPEMPYTIPNIPDARPIATPDERDVAPPRDPPYSPDDASSVPDSPAPVDPALMDTIKGMLTNNGDYQPCCPDPTTDVGGNPDDPPGAGVHGPPISGPVPIPSIVAGSPTTINTGIPHGWLTGYNVLIVGSSGVTPSINGTHAITVTGASTFTIAVATAGALSAPAYASRV